MATCLEAPQTAKSRTESNVLKIRSEIKKPQNHMGKMTNYTYDKKGFKKYITSLKPGFRASWRNVSIKFNVRIKSELRPSNAGQVPVEVAKSFGKDVSRLIKWTRLYPKREKSPPQTYAHKSQYSNTTLNKETACRN